MRTALALSLLLSLLAAPLLPAAEPAFANAAEDEPTAAGSEATANTATQDEDDDATPVARSSGEDFVPSVRISEDLSVSFPTDI